VNQGLQDSDADRRMATVIPIPGGEPVTDWTAWTSTERESFFNAIARHRRAAWRVTCASMASNVLTGLVVAILMAPLFYATLILLLDIINLAIPMPNLAASVFTVVESVTDAPETVPASTWLQLAAWAALPGLVWMAVVIVALRRMLQVSAMFDSGEIAARAPNVEVLAQQRFANVVAEMAIAANLPQPRVLVVERSVLNAAVFGRDEQHATIVASQALLERLNRDEMQGVAAHLIGSIANGDMAIGLRAAVTISLFGLIARLGTVPVNGEGAAGRLARIFRDTLVPTAKGARRLAAELADPFADPSRDAPKQKTTPQAETRWEKIRPFLWMPLAGPLVITGFFGGIVSSFVLGPLLAFTWRARKYMADATAVRLTRDPDTLGQALDEMGKAGSGAAFAPWTAHLSVVNLGAGQASLLGGGVVPMFPSVDRRLRALKKLGAQFKYERAPQQIPLRVLLIVTPLSIIAGLLIAVVLPLLVWVSLALTMLFTALPVGALHVFLRWLAS
jgi:Zn-dependent protease with chaperone function